MSKMEPLFQVVGAATRRLKFYHELYSKEGVREGD